MSALKYLLHYPPSLLVQVQARLDDGSLGDWLARRYPETHQIQSDNALYQYVTELKQRHLKNAPAPTKVLYDNQQHPVKGTLGTNTQISRVQGSKLKAKHEIRIATLFRAAPEAFLRMITVHELAHLREKNHDKAFYQLCCHMEPDYHQLEFDTRLWLTLRELA
ncbi:MAG: M48 family metallopeptidase [Aquitalea sp.]|nr:M48 family metallopeptidase [Aquitalea sp.]